MRRVLTHTSVIIAAAFVLLLASVVLAFNNHNSDDAQIVLGKTELSDAPLVEPAIEQVAIGESVAAGAVPKPRPVSFNAAGNGEPSEYRGSVKAPKDLKFFLVVGSDARPGQDVLRSRADSIHIAAVDPQSRYGTIFGLPRDSYVNIPGHGRNKINAAMVYGGPDLLVRTVRELTGMPIEYWAVTSFVGISKITNTLGGVDINVPYDMHDPYSGADFKKGWHHMNGEKVLAFSRARHGVPGGDFGRSENQGRVIKHALEKMRHEVKAEPGIKRWLKILYQYSHLNMSMKDAFELGKLARQLAPADLKNIVAPGSAQTVNGSSVVVLSDEAYRMFEDVRADAVKDGNTTRAKARPMPTPEPTPKPTKKPGSKPGPTPTPRPPLIPLPTPPA
jgi:LCP family protein required for cell wall assembly